MAEQKTSISELTAATTVATTDLLFISQGSGSSWTSKKATVSQLPFATSTHAHGNIQAAGTLQTVDVAVANGDKLVVTDASNSSKVARTSLAFDGSTTTQFLSKKGTFETALTAHQSLTSYYTKSETSSASQMSTALAGKQPTGNYLTAHQSLTGYVPTSRTVAGQQLTANVTAATISTAIGLENYSLTSHTHSQYLTAVPSTYKTYADTKTQLGTDGFKTYAATLSSLSSTYSLTSHTHSGYVPTSRTVAGMQLTGNVTLKNLSFGTKNYNGSTALTVTAGDLGALTAHQSLSTCLKNWGDQTISNGNRLFLKSGTMDHTVVPTSSVQSPGLTMQDKNAYAVGYVLCDRNTSGRQVVLVRAKQEINGSDSYADIGVAVDADNTKYAYCPTPPSSSNSTCIATTEWVRSRMSGDYVSKSALTAAVAAVGAVPSGDGATLSAVIDKYNALVAALTALAT